MSWTNINWLFLDLGWTLMNEAKAHLQRCEKTVQALFALSKPVTVDALIEECDKAAAAFAPSPYWGALQQLGVTMEEQNMLRGQAPYPKDLEELYPDTVDTLKVLSNRLKLGVIANQPAGTEERLVRHGIRNYFDLVFSSTEQGVAKPNPRIFKLAARATGVEPAQIVMVGDRLDNDIRPAKASGWRTIRILRGFHRVQQPRDEADEPDATVKHLSEIPPLLGGN
jgi:HAD superfamily hydrolase (TIGR01549 family)